MCYELIIIWLISMKLWRHQACKLKQTGVLDQSNQLLKVLENPVIVDNILRHLSISDILQCSLVCQLWLKICRRFLQVHKNLKIVLKSNICYKLSKLDHVLSTSFFDLPFVGLELSLKPNRFCYCSLYWDLRHYLGMSYQKDPKILYPFLVERLPLQQLIIDYVQNQNCIGEAFLQTLLLTRAPSSTLYLEVKNWPANIPSLWEYLKIDRNEHDEHRNEDGTESQPPKYFQSLKTCNLSQLNLHSPDFANFVVEIVKSAPALKNLYGVIDTKMLMGSFENEENVLTISNCQYHVIRQLKLTTPFECGNFKVLGLLGEADQNWKLTVLEIRPTIMAPGQSSIKPEVKKSLTIMVESSRNTLIKLNSFDSLHLLSFVINKKTGPLLNLQKLYLKISPFYQVSLENWKFLKSINFQQDVPNLRSLTLNFNDLDNELHKKCLENYEINKDELLRDSPKFKCLSVSKLKIVHGKLTLIQSVPLWYEMADIFPMVKSFNPCRFWNYLMPEFWDQVGGLPWKGNLKTVSLGFFELSEGSLLVFLTELLEEICCDIFGEEFDEIEPTDYHYWSYAATRNPFCYETGILDIRITMLHRTKCRGMFAHVDADLKNWFDVLSLWIAEKIPGFSLRIKYKPCGTTCYPFPFTSDLTHTTCKEESRFQRTGMRTVWLFGSDSHENTGRIVIKKPSYFAWEQYIFHLKTLLTPRDRDKRFLLIPYVASALVNLAQDWEYLDTFDLFIDIAYYIFLFVIPIDFASCPHRWFWCIRCSFNLRLIFFLVLVYMVYNRWINMLASVLFCIFSGWLIFQI